jgi:hypothetical protein
MPLPDEAVGYHRQPDQLAQLTAEQTGLIVPALP